MLLRSFLVTMVFSSIPGCSALGDGSTPLVDAVAAAKWSEGNSLDAPKAREAPSVVWTGTELIVWGGVDGDEYSPAGARYDPKSDRWSAISGLGAPSARAWHTAVWTGAEMLVWGGVGTNEEVATGGRYDPRSDSWRPLTTEGAPTARGSHVAVWTGTEMIVWAGVTDSNSFSTGGRYDPKTDRWTPIRCDIEQMLPRTTTAVWTGREMLVWGGINGSYVLGHGVRYDPETDDWRSISAEQAPSARAGHVAAWTGTEFIVWGGRGHYSKGAALADGARYSPAADRWSPLPQADAVSARDGAAVAWTGDEFCVLGGRTDDPAPSKPLEVACYQRAGNQWRLLAAPVGSQIEFCAWTGSGLVACGKTSESPTMTAWRRSWR